MSLQRVCDICGEPAGFMVAAWNEEAENLNETADVCTPKHAKAWIEVWLKDYAGIEESA